jgi:hypothetical protein
MNVQELVLVVIYSRMYNEDQSNSKVTYMARRLPYRMLGLLLHHSILLKVYCMV